MNIQPLDENFKLRNMQIDDPNIDINEDDWF